MSREYISFLQTNKDYPPRNRGARINFKQFKAELKAALTKAYDFAISLWPFKGSARSKEDVQKAAEDSGAARRWFGVADVAAVERQFVQNPVPSTPEPKAEPVAEPKEKPAPQPKLRGPSM